MRRSLLLTLTLFIAITTFAQSRAILLNETFDNPTIPEGWTVKENGFDNWSVSTTNYAGGNSNEIKLYWSPAFYGITRFCTPTIDLTGISSVVFSFKHYFDNYQTDSSEIGIATSSDNGNTWNIAWSQSYSENGQHNIHQTITTIDMGNSSVMFCIYFNGNALSFDNWYFDDITILTPEDNDAKLLSIDAANYMKPGELEIAFSIQNIGNNALTTFDASYEIDGNIVNETFNTNLSMFESEQFTFSEKANLIPGNYKIEINITSVNGNNDDDTDNNSMTENISVTMGTTMRIPMIEHFSSSTCGPCVYINSLMQEVCSNNEGKFAYVKYPMYWPSSGDPYCTDESKARKDYYGLNVVPQVFYDAVNLGAVAVTEEQLNQSVSSDAYVNIKGAFNVEGTTINVIADVLPYINLEGCKVFVSVNEKTTTGNAVSVADGGNGETEFHHIMMKMLDDAEGNDLTAEAGEYQRFEFSYDMAQTHVEEMSDLEVAVWVQHNNTKEIFNSVFLNEYTTHNYPVQNLQMTENENTFNITWEAPEQGNPTAYDIIVNNELVSENSQDMTYSFEGTADYAVVEVIAKYGESESIGAIVSNIINEEEPCLSPTNLGATIEQDVEGYEYKYKVTMTWDAVEEATAYKVFVNGSEFGTTSTNFFVTGFDNEETFDFSLTTLCQSGESEESEPYTVVIQDDSLEEYDNSFEIYPNPANDFVKVSAYNCQLSVVKIYNVMGILIDEIEVNSNEININISNYNQGIYFFNIDGEIVKIIKN